MAFAYFCKLNALNVNNIVATRDIIDGRIFGQKMPKMAIVRLQPQKTAAQQERSPKFFAAFRAARGR